MNHAATTNGDCQEGLRFLRRPRVLLSAYSCCPDFGSEPGIGWWRAVEIARYCDTWVLTEANELQPRISAHLKKHGPIPNLEFVYVRRRRWEHAVEYRPLLSYVAYRRWIRRAYRVAKQLHAQVGFDIAHQVTFASFREPGYLYRLGIPFVWGPVGGAQDYPWRFLPGAGISEARLEATRTVLSNCQLYASPRIRAAAKSAAAIFTSNFESQRKFRQVLGVDSILLCDVGAEKPLDEAPIRRSDAGPIRLVWVGVLTTRKALELLIEALALVPRDVQYELRVLGEGPRLQAWRRLAERRGISANVRWCGQVSHDDVLEHFRWADVLVFTSLRDTTGTVVLEALAASKPVVCLDHQGAGEIVTPQCGIKIPVTNRRDVQQRLCDTITLLQRDRRRCHALGQGARRRAAEYLWSLQARRIAEEYNRILESVGSDARCDLEAPTDSANDFRHDAPFEEETAQVGSVTR